MVANTNEAVYRTFIACMEAFLHGKRIAPSLSDEQWDALYTLAKHQSLSGALFAAVSPKVLPTALAKTLRRDAFLTLTAYERQEQAIRLVRQTLESAAIPFAFFKGAVIRAYYPDPSMRSMGDIDAIIPENDRERAHEALTAAGCVYASRTPEVWVYDVHGVCLELHTIVRRYDAAQQAIVEYDTFWEDTVKTDACETALQTAAHAAYVITHLALHFEESGCGLRQLMDVAVCFAHDPDEAVWDEVLARLETVKMAAFARRLLWLVRTWFDVAVPERLCVPMDEECEAFMRSRFLDEGTFGTGARMMLARQRRDARAGRQATLWHWMFPDKTVIRRRYAYAKNPLLLPVAYAHRLVDGVTKNRRVHQKRLAYAKEQEDVLAYEVAMFEKIGL